MSKIRARLKKIKKRKERELEVKINKKSVAPTAIAPGVYKFEIYADGSWNSELRTGGYGVAIFQDGRCVHEISEGALETTGNRMEIIAVIEGIKALNILSPLAATWGAVVYSDSEYVTNSPKWIPKWKKNGWMTSGIYGESAPVKNRDLWEELDDLLAGTSISFQWVRGHGLSFGNNRSDFLSKKGRQDIEINFVPPKRITPPPKVIIRRPRV